MVCGPLGPEQFRNPEFYRRFMFYVYIKYFHNRVKADGGEITVWV